jgi:hypothetical protein
MKKSALFIGIDLIKKAAFPVHLCASFAEFFCIQKLLDFHEMDVRSLVEVFAVSGTHEESIMNHIIHNVFRNENVSATITTLANRLKRCENLVYLSFYLLSCLTGLCEL